MDIREEFEKKCQLVYAGKRVWHRYMDLYDFSIDDAVIVLPYGEHECHYYTLLYLKEFVKYSKINKIYIFIEEPFLEKIVPLFYEGAIIQQLCHNDMEPLIKYLSCFDEECHILFSSLDKPKGRDVLKFIDQGFFTMEFYIVFGIYRLHQIPVMEKPVYIGDDAQEAQFCQLWKKEALQC